jgi:hypothetical protein
MLEIAPRITFDGNTLELRRDFGDREKLEERVTEIFSRLEGYQIIEGERDTTVQVEVEKVVRPDNKEVDYFAEGAEELIRNLSVFTLFDFDEQRDGVFSLELWSNTGAKGVIYPQLQRWLNNSGVTEVVAKEAINAIALPLGEAGQKTAKKEFRFQTDGKSSMGGEGGFTFGVMSKREQFGLEKIERGDGEYPTELSGKVEWNWLDLMTIGSCACWGPAGDDREHIYITDEVVRLYEMDPHNVDSPSQSLGLVLGAASLALAASKYEGTEDILANATWTVVR